MKTDIETENAVREFCGQPKRGRISLWFQRIVRRIWLRTVRKQLWRCAHNLIMLGQINGDIQPDIDAAKDALYQAIRKLEEDSPNGPSSPTPDQKPL